MYGTNGVSLFTWVKQKRWDVLTTHWQEEKHWDAAKPQAEALLR
jgi:hypothetical protein